MSDYSADSLREHAIRTLDENLGAVQSFAVASKTRLDLCADIVDTFAAFVMMEMVDAVTGMANILE